MRLRPLRWWDIEQVMPLERELFVNDPWPPEAFWAELALGLSRVYLVAEDPSGRIVGYAGLSCPTGLGAGDAEIMTLAVAPDAQGRGLGRELLDTLRSIAEERGAGRLLLEVRSDNVPAQALYAAAGFEQMSRRPDYYRRTSDDPGPSADALILRLGLGDGGPSAPDSLEP
jgi:[ribosomal protein S18]-alanine N-acetyltransferase